MDTMKKRLEPSPFKRLFSGRENRKGSALKEILWNCLKKATFVSTCILIDHELEDRYFHNML